MSTIPESLSVLPRVPAEIGPPRSWYALLTRARHEKFVAQKLLERGITSFVPLVKEVRHWSDRRRSLELPLFNCYVFAQLTPTSQGRLAALRIDGVFRLVGARAEGTAIPDEQIDAVKRLVEGCLPWHSHPFLKIGQRVRIRSGALEGVEGILLSRSGESTLVVSIEAIQRSLAIRIDGYRIEPI